MAPALNLQLSQFLAHAVQIKPDDFAGYPDGWDEPTACEPQDDLALYAKIIRDNIRIDQSACCLADRQAHNLKVEGSNPSPATNVRTV